MTLPSITLLLHSNYETSLYPGESPVLERLLAMSSGVSLRGRQQVTVCAVKSWVERRGGVFLLPAQTSPAPPLSPLCCPQQLHTPESSDLTTLQGRA